MIAVSKYVKLPPKPSRDDLILALGSLVFVLALVLAVGIPVYTHLEARTRLVAVKGNAATLQLAVESFARQHLGQYPDNVGEVLDLLPQAQPPLNPLDGKPLQFSTRPGDLTYKYLGKNKGYQIKAWIYAPGKKCREFLTLKGGKAMMEGNYDQR